MSPTQRMLIEMAHKELTSAHVSGNSRMLGPAGDLALVAAIQRIEQALENDEQSKALRYGASTALDG